MSCELGVMGCGLWL